MITRRFTSNILMIIMVPLFFLRAQNYAGVGFGGTDFHIIDAHASPLIFGSLGITPDIQFIHKGENSLQYFEGSYYDNLLSSSSSNFNTQSWGGRLRFSFVQLIANPGILGRALSIYAGGSACTFFTRQDYYYYYKPSAANAVADVSWQWSHSLDISLAAEYDLTDREFLLAQIDMPVVSSISRPQYSPSEDYNYSENVFKIKMFGAAELFPNYFSLDIRLNYQRPLFWNFNMQIGYEFFYSYYNKPSDIKMYMNNFRGGLFYCF